MAKTRYKVIVSDLHLGFGPRHPDGSRNLLEEFHYDEAFEGFLQHYSNEDFEKAEVELILNGDILNHLHTTPEDPDCDSLTEKVSLERTQKIIRGHPRFFDALSSFAKAKNHRVIYLMGNHDMGIAWPKVQQLLRDRVDPGLIFYLSGYEEEGVLIEHGNRFLADNRVDLDNLFLTKGEQQPVLKMPWGSFFAIHFINPLKMARPYIGKVYPFKLYLRWAMIHDTFFALKTIFQLVLYFLKINFIRNPKRNFSFFDTWKILREFSFPVELDNHAKALLKERTHLRFVALGHTHHARYRQFESGKEYINTGSWNDMIGLDIGSLGSQLHFTFAEIQRGPASFFKASLKEWRGPYKEVKEIL